MNFDARFVSALLLVALMSVSALGSAQISARAADPGAGSDAAIAAAIVDTGRPEADRARDAARLPAATLAFAGVKPGDSVGELLPGGGYYTRLLARLVGPNGHVYALAPPRPTDAPPDMPDFAARVRAIAADPKYKNVTVISQPLTDIEFPRPLDLVWTSQNYHDFHNVKGVDLVTLNRQVFAALKPHGVYLIVDHAAAAGTADRDTSTLHRIDPATVRREVTAAGFVEDGSSDILHRSEDPHTASVFDASIRGKTDQFLLRFKKP
jgi:predicted methyltransferase